MKYKAVIFDMFGTLVDSFPQDDYNALMSEMANIVGVEPRFFNETWVASFKLRITGKMNMRQCTEHCVRQAGLNVDNTRIDTAVARIMSFMKEYIVPRPDVIESLEKIHELGLKIGLITDCASSLEELWDGLTFSQLIDVPVFSSAVGIKKPAPEIYQIALDRLGLQAAECLYVGDGGSFELTGAQNVGMTAIRIDGNKNPDVVQYELQDWQGTTITAISQVLNHLS